MYARSAPHAVIFDDCEPLSYTELVAVRPDIFTRYQESYTYGINGDGEIFQFGISPGLVKDHYSAFCYSETEKKFLQLTFGDAASRADKIWTKIKRSQYSTL